MKLYLLILAFVLYTEEVLTQGKFTNQTCTYAVDLAFLIDSSNSIRSEYHKELLFVQRIATSFQISETGTHAGVVIFSDAKNYTKVSIKFNDYKTTESFNKAVAKSEFIGYRTRIDYAFTKAEKELFTISGGARPRMKKVLILITDGHQNPTKNATTNEPYDPVKASQALYDAGVMIFVVGIGSDINQQQLRDIARDKTRVYYADTLNTLISDGFVKNVSKKLCVGGSLTNVTTALPPILNTTKSPIVPCTDKCSSCCCGNKNLYINIFQANSGQHYIMQGVQLMSSGKYLNMTGSKTGHVDKTVKLGTPQSVENTLNILKSVLPSNPKLLQVLRILLRNNNMKNISPGKRVAREAIERTQDQMLIQLSKIAGCNRFYKDLQKYHWLDKIMSQDRVTLFCPIDSVFETMQHSNGLINNEKELLLNHVAFKYDNEGVMYRTLSNDGKITLTKGEGNKVMANGIPIVLSLSNEKMNIFLMRNFIEPRVKTVKQILKSRPDLSEFYEVWKKSSKLNIFKSRKVQKLCFTENICAPLTRQLQDHIQTTHRFKQFTVLAPTNEVIAKNERSYLKTLHGDKGNLKRYLQDHIYLGLIDQQAKQIAHSISAKPSVITTGVHGNKKVLINARNQMLTIQESIPVKEGILHIINEVE